MRRCLVAVLSGALMLGVTACGGSTHNLAGGILFIRTTGNFSRIYLWRSGAAAPVPVGPKGYAIGSVAWSPNAKKIAFEATPGGLDSVKPFGIYEMRADGAHLRELISDPKWAEYPIWSPDGSRMFYSQTGYGGKQFIVSIRTGHKQPLNTHIGRIYAWGRAGITYVGPDYRTVMLFHPRTGVSSVFAKTTVYPGDDKEPGWGVGPLAWVSGGRLAVVDDSSTIFVYSSHGRPVTHFAVPSGGKACGMVSSRDGTELLVAVVTPRAAVLWTTNLDGTQWKRLPLRGGAGSCDVSWR